MTEPPKLCESRILRLCSLWQQGQKGAQGEFGSEVQVDVSQKQNDWWVYMLRCADGSLYTGITTDLSRRLAQHNGEQAGGARYTRCRRPVTLVWREAGHDRGSALRREAAVKRLPRHRKLAMAGLDE